MLRANGSSLCPVFAIRTYRSFFDHFGESPNTLFPASFRARLVQIMKWAAVSNNIPAAVVNTHSLRAGGATALFSAGVDWITIQRWGRWKSFAFHDYVWHDFSGFMDLGVKIASTKGLNKHLVEVAPYHKRVSFAPTSANTTGTSFDLPFPGPLLSTTVVSCFSLPILLSSVRNLVLDCFIGSFDWDRFASSLFPTKCGISLSRWVVFYRCDIDAITFL